MYPTLISVEEAKALVQENSSPKQPVHMPVGDALNTVLSEDIFSPIDMPSFLQSAMDGYAVAFDDIATNESLPVAGESFAGINEPIVLQRQTAVRVFTGAPVPGGADTVVMQEHVQRSGNRIRINSPELTKAMNVRAIGAEISKGALAMQKGELLTPAAIGFLAGLGITRVPVFPFPKISIITTGKEIVKPGADLRFGQVYESNSFTLTAALQQYQVKEVNALGADDNLEQLVSIIGDAFESSDILLLTGGVSVGDYDLVPAALEASGVNIIFHKVKQRPGKPLLFGIKDKKLVFGLPGNPSSVLSCFYNYVLPAIQQMMHRSTPFIETRMMKMKESFVKQVPLTQFLKGNYSNDEVLHLGAQESFRLSSFAVANCLIEIPAEKSMVEKGEPVKVHVI